MSIWFRVFGASETAPEPAALLEHLHAEGVTVEGHFKKDDFGWFQADFVLSADPQPLCLNRYLAEADDVRDDLNSWAAWLETIDDPVLSGRLMQLMIGANQVFTVPCARDRFEEHAVREFLELLCRYLAKTTAGVYQVDTRGFFDPDGRLLVNE
ncbi:MAG: hypothetical protein JNM56_09085 [Planctomycetia bacterium]|nr:hypothetical protein [Planctomycetia bacterium]